MIDQRSKVDELDAVKRGVRRSLREHAVNGRPVWVMREGKVIELSPAEILDELRDTEQELGITDER